jgi:hypothetical protein
MYLITTIAEVFSSVTYMLKNNKPLGLLDILCPVGSAFLRISIRTYLFDIKYVGCVEMFQQNNFRGAWLLYPKA